MRLKRYMPLGPWFQSTRRFSPSDEN
ncbi:hypothetical protein EMIT0196P_20396 [Pseudomonas chlororaphis]